MIKKMQIKLTRRTKTRAEAVRHKENRTIKNTGRQRGQKMSAKTVDIKQECKATRLNALHQGSTIVHKAKNKSSSSSDTPKQNEIKRESSSA